MAPKEVKCSWVYRLFLLNVWFKIKKTTSNEWQPILEDWRWYSKVICHNRSRPEERPMEYNFVFKNVTLNRTGHANEN